MRSAVWGLECRARMSRREGFQLTGINFAARGNLDLYRKYPGKVEPRPGINQKDARRGE